MERNIDNNWNDLILKFFNGELSLSEEEALFLWLKEKPERLVLFEEYRNLWLSTSVKAINYKTNPVEAWKKVDKSTQQVSHEIQMNSERFKTGASSLKRIVSIAAALVLVFVLGIFSSRFFGNRKISAPDNVCRIVAPLGSKTSIFLPDGTHVWLNAGSKLTYNGKFGVIDRQVYLEGEAHFKVKTDKSKPFLVHTAKMDVKALGTTFNVKAYADEKTAVATLVEGVIKVEVTGKNKDNVSYTLKPRQNITVIDDNVTIRETASVSNHETENSSHSKFDMIKPISEKIYVAENVKTELYTSWKDNRWKIEGEELGDLAVMLERRFNVTIHFKSEKLKNYKFTGIIQNETLEQVMEILRLTTPLKYTLGKGESWLEIDPCLLDNYSRILEKK